MLHLGQGVRHKNRDRLDERTSYDTTLVQKIKRILGLMGEVVHDRRSKQRAIEVVWLRQKKYYLHTALVQN